MFAQNRDLQTIRLTDRVSLPVPRAWRVIPKTTRGLDELYLPAGPTQPAGMRLRVAITEEARNDHADALTGLRQIETEYAGPMGYVSLCGWPALQRVATVPTPQRLADVDNEEPALPPTTMSQVTVAVAAGNTIIRFDSILSAPALPADVETVEGVAHSLVCADIPALGQTERELQTIRQRSPLRLMDLRVPSPPSPPTEVGAHVEELHPEIRERPILTLPPPLQPSDPIKPPAHPPFSVPTPLSASPLPSGLGQFGELQIAVAKDAQHVLIGANFESGWTSSDGGATYQRNVTINFPRKDSLKGDPSVGVGQSGDFYWTTINAAPTTTCTLPIEISTNSGQTFNFVNDAATCPNTGTQACFTDQEQMAVDINKPGNAPTKDQLYVVWRNFAPSQGIATQCTGNFGSSAVAATVGVTATIACSFDSGVTWTAPIAVGPLGSDVGRPTVGPDGTVFVTFMSGANLMIRKFGSCVSGFNPEGKAIPIATLKGVGCPVAGLDRCFNYMEASPQAAVDDKNPEHVMVAYAEGNGVANGPETVTVADSQDGGKTWARFHAAHSAITAQRFLPWICTSNSIAYVTWYDRRFATAAKPDLTAYFANSIDLSDPTKVVLGVENDLSSPSSDPQCASGFPFGAYQLNDNLGCPASTPPILGNCQNSSGGGSQAACGPSGSPACTNPKETCVVANGAPKYGDYNGNACMGGSVFAAFASDTVPSTGAFGGVGNMAIYAGRISSTCGNPGQACCSTSGLATCNQNSLTCVQNSCIQCTIGGGPGTSQTACPPATVLPTGPPTPPSTAQLELMECDSMCLNSKWLATYYPGVANPYQQCNQACATGKVPFKLDCSEGFGKALNTCLLPCGSTEINSGPATTACKTCLTNAGANVPTTCTTPPILH